MFQKKNHPQEGIILIAVVMVISVLILVVLSMISLNSSQSVSSESEIRRLQAEALGTGAVQARLLDPKIDPSTFSTTLDNVDFEIEITEDTSGSGPYGTNPLDVVVSY